MAIRVIIRSVGFAGLLFVVSVGCAKKASTGVTIASINGETITQDAYYSHLERKQVVQVQTPQGGQDAQVSGSLGLQALRDLVNRKLLLQMAVKEGVMPTTADIDKELAFQTKRRPDFVSFLTDQGMTLDMIRNDLQFDLARERLLTKGITVTPADVDVFMKENPEEFMEPAQAQLLYIVVSSDAKKAAVDKELGSGQQFQIVATKYSEAPQARELGGMYQESRIKMMPRKLQELVDKTPELKITDWQKDGRNWVKFYVQSKRPAKAIPMDETKKEFVRRQLAMQRGERTNNLGQRLNDALRTAQIDVTDNYLKGPWTKAYERAKSALAQSPTGAQTPTKAK